MTKVSRRNVAVGMAAVASNAIGGQNLANADCIDPLPPQLEKMSVENRSRLISLLARSTLKNLVASSEPKDPDPEDPNWPEFWLQMRPKELTDFVGKINDNLLFKWQAQMHEQSPSADFSEEAYTEFVGGFTETCSTTFCEADERNVSKPNANTVVKIRAGEGDKRIDDPSFYRDIMKAIAASRK